jgi:hypothetical protein
MIFSLGCMIAESAVTEVSVSGACGAKRTRPAHHIVGVRQVDDDDLVGVVYILATACQLGSGKAGRGQGKGAGRATYTQMKWSDSRVSVWNEMLWGWMPSAVS